MTLDLNVVSTVGIMISVASLLVWHGSTRSLQSLQSSYTPLGRTKRKATFMTSLVLGVNLSWKEALMIPVFASISLFTVYLLLTYVSPEYLAVLLSLWTSTLCVVPLSFVLRPMLGANIFNGTFCCLVALGSIITKNWVLGNILGYGVATFSIQVVQLEKMKTTILLLVGLFFYDIFFVFFTPAMLTVATKIDAPNKIVIPSNVLVPEGPTHKRVDFMLGLGDIILPGIFISQVLRFCFLRFYKKKKGQVAMVNGERRDSMLSRSSPTCQSSPVKSSMIVMAGENWLSSFSVFCPSHCAYFHCVFLSYTVALIVTSWIAIRYEQGQPALLYIVPLVTVSVALLAVARGEFSVLWNFDQNVEEKGHEKMDDREEEGPKELDGGGSACILVEKEDPQKSPTSDDREALLDTLDNLSYTDLVLFVFGRDANTLADKRSNHA